MLFRSVDVLGVDHALELLNLLLCERLEEVLARVLRPGLGIGSNVRRARLLDSSAPVPIEELRRDVPSHPRS